jgi:predicted nucleic acid-binding protein
VIVLDTSVLIYAVGIEHPLREPCRRVFAAQGTGLIDAAVTVEVIQEFTHARARRFPRAEAASLARDYAASLRILETTADDLERGLDLFATHPALGAFDSIVAAIALNRVADALVSADRGFGSVRGLRWIDPAAPDFDALLGSVSSQQIE